MTTVSKMTKNQVLSKVKELHTAKGWNSVYAFLKRESIPHKVQVCEFGLDNTTNAKQKYDWIKAAREGEFRAHLYSQAIKSRKTKWSYNRIRAQSIVLL